MIERDPSGRLQDLRDQALGPCPVLYTSVLEREEQARLAVWLSEQKRLGRLQYDWSATHRKATRRVGMPDFSVWANGLALLGEMKRKGGRLGAEQAAVHAEFWRSGTPVHIWYSATEAIGCIEAWLQSIGV
jgi:hypothetical protein